MLRVTPTHRRSSQGRQVAIITVFTLFIIAGGFWTNLYGSHTTNITFKTFIEPITVEHAKPVYHSWGNLGGLGNPQHKAAGKKLAASEDTLPMHKFLSNGLLEVNPEGPHPIYQLIEFSEKKWEAKLQRASKTLSEAVIEYERRYQRLPPRGFDKWCALPFPF